MKHPNLKSFPSNRNLSLSLFSSPWLLMAVDCVSHCVSIEAQPRSYRPFLLLEYFSFTSQSASPNVDWRVTFVCLYLFYFFASYLHIYYYHIYLHMLLAWADKWTICTCTKEKISNGTLAFYELMMICSICSTFTELSCKLMLFYVHTHTWTHTLSDTPLWWQPCSF